MEYSASSLPFSILRSDAGKIVDQHVVTAWYTAKAAAKYAVESWAKPLDPNP